MQGAAYEEYSKLFHVTSAPVEVNDSQVAFKALFFVVLAFISLSMVFIGDKKKQNPLAYVFNAAVASASIGLGTVYVSNFVGVYV
ncbi:hypothetical protein DICA3_C03840 [Diutina catenulata]